MENIFKIDENTWRIEDEFVRFFLLKGKEKAVLIDSGASTHNAREIAEGLTKLPIFLLNTHGDGDHVCGSGAFDEIYMTKEDFISCGIADRFPNTKLKEIKDGDVFDLGDRKLEIITIPGHTKGSVAILDVENRQLFAGDSVQNGFIFMFDNRREPEKFEAALKKLIAISDRYDRIIASHGEPVLDGKYTKKVLEAWKKVLSGSLEYKITNLFGTDVKTYDAGVCGFYCDLK